MAYKEGVYDITDFIEGHPGGAEKIMQAAGGRVDPFWRLYQQHESQSFVLELLESFRVGNLHPDDKLPETAAPDLYGLDPPRNPQLVVQSSKPFNGETPAEVIAEVRKREGERTGLSDWFPLQSFLTPNDLFYTRNHLPVPFVDMDQYVLEVVGPDGKSHKFTVEELASKYGKASVVATIQCAGNRRNEMTSIKSVRGGRWDSGAISNAEWTGVYLRDVLLDLGFKPSDQIRHVHFEGLDRDAEKNYGASIPAELAFSAEKDVLLAFEMNGQPLPRDHGYPVRAVVPGIVGARNVKWLGKIVLSDHESNSHWQRRDYRGFPPNVDWDNVDWDSMPSIQELPVISAISVARQEGDSLVVHGYAWSGGGRKVIRVDLTTDEGAAWTQAQLRPKPKAPHGRDYAWTLWEAKIPVPPGRAEVTVASRATDDSYNTQPEKVENLWNMRGVLNNAWARKTVPLNTDKRKD